MTGEHFMLADEPEAFADAIVGLLRDARRAGSTRRRGAGARRASAMRGRIARRHARRPSTRDVVEEAHGR